MKYNQINIRTLFFSTIVLFSFSFLNAQECDLEGTENRRKQATSIQKPLNYVIQMTMKRGRKYNGTAFFIHPRVLLTAGHNLRKRPQIIYTRVKSITLRVGATGQNDYIATKKYKTKQNENIYTLDSFNSTYNIYGDYGVIILPDDELYKKIGGTFKLTTYNPQLLNGKEIKIAGYPGDKKFATMWIDKTTNFFAYTNPIGNPKSLEYLKYDFFTKKGISGAPVWYSENDENYVFAIHTYGNDNDDKKCNTATLITKEIYDDIVSFCAKKGVKLTN